MRVLTDRARAGAFPAIGLPQVAMFGFFLCMTYYFQQILGYTPVQAGLAFLPLAVAIGISSTVIAGLLTPRLAPRTLIVPALLLMAAGMAILIGLDVDHGAVYVTRLLHAELLIGLGLGCVLTPAINSATSDLDPADARIASATLNAVQQLGGSVGTALLNTVATTAATHLARSDEAGTSQVEAAVHGLSAAITAATAILLATAFNVALVLIRPVDRAGSNTPASSETECGLDRS
jgi:MFS family permease